MLSYFDFPKTNFTIIERKELQGEHGVSVLSFG